MQIRQQNERHDNGDSGNRLSNGKAPLGTVHAAYL